MAKLDDRHFVAIARKAGYLTEEQLRRCRQLQVQAAKAGQPRTLYEWARDENLLTPDRIRRFERWAEQIAKKDEAPLEEESEDEVDPHSAPTEPIAKRPRRRIHESAAALALPSPRCERCGGDLDSVAVVEGRARERDDGRIECACAPSRAVEPARAGPDLWTAAVVAGVVLAAGAAVWAVVERRAAAEAAAEAASAREEAIRTRALLETSQKREADAQRNLAESQGSVLAAHREIADAKSVSTRLETALHEMMGQVAKEKVAAETATREAAEAKDALAKARESASRSAPRDAVAAQDVTLAKILELVKAAGFDARWLDDKKDSVRIDTGHAIVFAEVNPRAETVILTKYFVFRLAPTAGVYKALNDYNRTYILHASCDDKAATIQSFVPFTGGLSAATLSRCVRLLGDTPPPREIEALVK